MKHILTALFLLSLITLTANAQNATAQTTTGHADSDTVITLENVTLIDGTGAAPRAVHNLVIAGDRIIGIDAEPTQNRHAVKFNMQGAYIMPLLNDCHAHLGLLKDTTMSSANYTPDNIHGHLLKFETYGVGAILCMGTDHRDIFPLRDASRHDSLSGATIYTAGIGFGASNGMPPVSFGMDQVFRPATPEEARKEVREIAPYHPDLLKMWIDDNHGKFPKMPPEIYTAIIDEAHKQGLRVAAHLYYLEDARKLVAAGLDIMAHSIRDKEIDADLLQAMKRKGVVYIPTLSLDEFAYSYADDPEWLKDPFFQASLEPGVYNMITSAAYRNKVAKDPATPQEQAALQVALKNLKKIYDAGILVAMGTDAGAQPIRTMGFSEHMEMQLMVSAGLTPLQAITVATHNGAILLRADKETGTLQVGKKANFIILSKDPTEDIRNSRTIIGIMKNGKRVSGGPLADAAR